MPYIKKLFDV